MSSFGEELKRERELRQITLREISEATKISLRYLDALERNDFTHLPGGVFNKGFVRAYAQFIGVDPEAMVNAYLLEEQSQAAREGRLQRPAPATEPTAPARGSKAPTGSPAKRVLSLLLLLVVVGVVAGVVVLWFRRSRSAESYSAGPASKALTPVVRRVEAPS